MGAPYFWSEQQIGPITFASVASDGAASRLGQVGPFGREGRVKAGYWTPTGGDQGANTASYRLIDLYNGGTAGTTTATANRVARVNNSTSQASLGAKTFTIVYPATGSQASAGTFGSADILYFSQSTAGGADSTGTVLKAGQLSLVVEFFS